MLRTFSLVGMAAQAESRRLKAKATATATRYAYYAAAGVMGLGAFIMLHVLILAALHKTFGPVGSAAIVLLLDLVVAGVFFLLASRTTVKRAEIEAEAVRNVALTGAAQSAIAGLTTKGAPLVALAGIAAAALWPKFRRRE